MFKNILFDLDGTLIDSALGITNSFIYALSKYNITVEREELNSLIGPPLMESFINHFRFDKEKAEEAVRYFREYFKEKGVLENELYPNVRQLLEKLKEEGYTLCIATSKPEVFTLEILAHYDIQKYFSFVSAASIDDTKIKKEDIVRYAIESLNLNPKETIMVGDRKHDIIGANCNKIASIGVLYGFGNKEELEKENATYIVNDVLDILECLNQKKQIERYKLIERSIITTYRSKIWAKFIKAIKEFELIKPNDRVCVCISGGKDSMILAKCFQELKRHSDFEFEVKYLVMDPGYSPKNLEKIKENLAILNVEAVIRETDIFEIANSQIKSPCYLCARMRRGSLYRLAEELGCNKIALGHHFDDVIETTVMNMLNAGSFQTMLPKLHSDNFNGMELIRPLYYVREKDIVAWKNYNNLSFLQCACKFTEKIAEDEIYASKRKETKELIRKLEKDNPHIAMNIFRSAFNINMNMILGYKDSEGYHSFLDNYDEVNYSE